MAKKEPDPVLVPEPVPTVPEREVQYNVLTEEKQSKYDKIAECARTLEYLVETLLATGDEKKFAKKAINEVKMWSSACIARYP